MGWKNVKEYFRIGHIVHVSDEGVCIGSPLIHDIIVVGFDGRILKPYQGTGGEIQRYQTELEAAPALFTELFHSPDTFEKSIPIYTFSEGKILDKLCEEPDPLSVTHDGCVIYENRYSQDREQVIRWAKQDVRIGSAYALNEFTRLQTELERTRIYFQTMQSAVRRLEAAHPDPNDATHPPLELPGGCPDTVATAFGCKVVPVEADEQMITAMCEKFSFLKRGAVKAAIEAAILAAPTHVGGGILRNDERAIALKQAANLVLGLASQGAATGQAVSFREMASAILALNKEESPQAR